MSTNDWRHGAACLDEDPELFFPRGEGAAYLAQTEAAEKVCAHCPVMQQCRQWALETGQEAGVWGGLSEADRRDMPRSKELQPCGTTAAYRRHKRRGEEPCEPCADAYREASAKWRKPRSAYAKPQTLAPCGTRSAYQRHIRRKEPIDAACRQADRLYDQQLRGAAGKQAAA